MEDQQPAASDLTDQARDAESRTDVAVATEVGQPEPEEIGVEPRGQRRRRFFKNRSSSGPTGRHRRDRAAGVRQDSTAQDETVNAATERAQDRDHVAIERVEDGETTAHEPAENTDEAATEAVDATEEPATDSAEHGEDAGTEAAEPIEETVRARKPVGRRLGVTVVAAAVLFVGSAAFAGVTVQPYLADRAMVATKLNVARTAANAITTLWSYTPENLDKLGDRAATYLSGDFEAQYRKFVDALVAPNKQAQVTNSTLVTGAAVESLEGPTAVAIVYTNTTSTSPVTKNIPSLRYLSYRLFMKRDHARWLVTRMTTITSLDLTPRL